MAEDVQSAVIDRFSAVAGKLQVRTRKNQLPGPDQPVDFDKAPFITQSRGPAGEIIRYYNFDVRSTTPATIWVFYKGNEPLTGQSSIVEAIPGDEGYNDFVRVVRVIPPPDYVPDTIRDARTLKQSGYELKQTAQLLNRPIVPRGSTAKERLNGATPELEAGWYKGKRVVWLRFDETELQAGVKDPVPTSPIYVTFNKNPGERGGGPPSGFRTEPGGVQTHNVASSLPGDLDYSPLWLVSVYDNVFFPSVKNETTVLASTFKAKNVATVNCPIVYIDATAH